MKKDSSLQTLMQQANKVDMSVLSLVIELVRNIANLSRIGGPKDLVVPSVSGQDLPPQLLTFLNTFARLRMSTYQERMKLRPGVAHVVKPGQRFDVNAWLHATIIQLKLAQTEDIGPRKVQLDIVSRYLERGGRWHNPTGVGEEQVKAWRKRALIGEYVFQKDQALRLTAFLVPADLDQRALPDQIAFLKMFGTQIREFYEAQMDDKFPAEAFWLLFDFSLHTDAELTKLIAVLKPLWQESIEDRLIGLIMHLLPSFMNIEDLIPDIIPLIQDPDTLRGFVQSLGLTRPVTVFEPDLMDLSDMDSFNDPAESAADEPFSWEGRMIVWTSHSGGAK
jgi:hypothetical protein